MVLQAPKNLALKKTGKIKSGLKLWNWHILEAFQKAAIVHHPTFNYLY